MAFSEVRRCLINTPVSMAYSLHGRGGSPSGAAQPNFEWPC